MQQNRQVVQNFKTKYLFIIILCSYNCKDSNNHIHDVKNIEINIDNIQSDFTKDLINIEKYIPLETTKNSLISTITKIIEKNRYLYILDRNEKQLLKFDLEGRFINKIHNIGKGAGEYTTLNDFEITENEIFLLARDSRKIIILDHELKFKKEIKLDSYYSNLISIASDDVLLYNNFSSNKTKTNISRYSISKNKAIEQFHDIKSSQFGQGYLTSPFDSYKNQIFGSFPNDYIIYIIKNYETIPYLRVDFGSKKSLPENSRYLNYEELEAVVTPQTISGIDRLKILKDNIAFNFIHNNQQKTVIYNINTAKIWVGIIEPVIDIPIISSQFVGKYQNDNIITYVESSDIVTGFTYGSKDYKEALKKIPFSQDITLQDNPILVIFSFTNEK